MPLNPLHSRRGRFTVHREGEKGAAGEPEPGSYVFLPGLRIERRPRNSVPRPRVCYDGPRRVERLRRGDTIIFPVAILDGPESELRRAYGGVREIPPKHLDCEVPPDLREAVEKVRNAILAFVPDRFAAPVIALAPPDYPILVQDRSK